MQTTPLQLAVGVATIANRGARFAPYLLLREEEPGKHHVPQLPTPLEPIPIKDPAIWTAVIQGMQNVIAAPFGTGYLFGKTPYTVAAKTGTAQVYSVRKRTHNGTAPTQASLPERLRDHSLLIAFAPIDKPQIALAIVVENSSLAVSAENHGPAIGIARKLLDYYLTTDKDHGSH
jgi:penicillin-binding protein 2